MAPISLVGIQILPGIDRLEKLCMRKLLPVMSVFLSLSFFQWRRPSATGAPSVIVDSKCCSVAPVGARTPRNFEITLKAWCHAGGCCREN